MSILEAKIDDETYRKFEEILSQYGKNVEEVVQMMVEKTIEDNSIDWLYTIINGEVRAKNIKTKKAIQLFNTKWQCLNNHNTNFASKNNKHNVYWINPDKRHLKENWYIILDDNINKILYLLFVPQNSISELKMRNDRICNVSITYNDNYFVDIHTGISFRKFLVDKIQYDSLIK